LVLEGRTQPWICFSMGVDDVHVYPTENVIYE
jgi:hypothetical protein